MPNFYLREAVSLLLKTTPILWVRIGSYALLWLGLLVYAAVVGGVAWLLSQLWSVLGIIVVIAALAGGFGIVRWVTRYYFYLLKAAHAAVMTEYIVHGKGPEGSQIEYGKNQVTSRFKDTSIMFAIDQVLDGVVKAFNRAFTNVTDFLPIPGMDSLQQFARRVSRFATTYIDEAILTRAYAQDEDNVWAVAKDGVILYAQCWKPILANAVALTLLSYVEFFVFLVVLGVPAVAVGVLIPALKIPLAIAVLLGAWMLKLAVADAYSLAATLLAYHRSTEGMEPDPEWQERLEQASDEFQELKENAAEKVSEYQERASGRSGDAESETVGGSGASNPSSKADTE
jgi:membrane protein implicated in regulation of membrane protease activity